MRGMEGKVGKVSETEGHKSEKDRKGANRIV